MKTSNGLRIFRLDAGSCNGCDIEVIGCLARRFNLERPGARVVERPEEANVVVLTGPVVEKGRAEVKRVLERIPKPNLAIAIGECALSKGIFDKSYSVVGPADALVKVDLYVPGCPPRPQAIIHAISKALGTEMAADKWPTPEGYRGKIAVDQAKCTGCGACERICPASAIETVDEERGRTVRFLYDRCTFCALCQEICPEKAIILTGEYTLATEQRDAAEVIVHVDLQPCAICGRPHAPPSQLKAAEGRISEREVEARAFKDEIEASNRICSQCKHTIERIRKGKELILRLTEVARSSPRP
jgi:membrane-bound hydrogenase subunit mbhJ